MKSCTIVDYRRGGALQPTDAFYIGGCGAGGTIVVYTCANCAGYAHRADRAECVVECMNGARGQR